ncbi:hypothetical protein [Streptococcus gallolyticus]|uniref:hypothetical protein n=2 Tax=Streptococcus gallolyticus TaxID=315405 RepID=UPI003D3011AF
MIKLMNREKELKYEVMQLAIYCDIIPQILKECSEISVVKLSFFSIFVRNSNNMSKIYDLRGKKNSFEKIISTYSGSIDRILDALPYIISAIDLLAKKELIKVVQGKVSSSNSLSSNDSKYVLSSFVVDALKESEKLSDEQFMKEVITNV